MSNERYVLLKIFENNIWQRSCPVEVTEGALISDTLIGNVCLQLALVNTTDKRIIRVYVDVYCFDKDGNPLLDGAPIGIIYSDAHMERGIPFGLDLTANLRSGRVDSVKCYITKVIYLDGNNWRENECTPVELDYKPIDSMEAPLLDIFAELYHQSYYKDNYEQFKYIPKETGEYWMCTCGRANEIEAGGCARCGMNKNWLLSSLTPTALKKIYKDRVDAAAAQERAAKAAQAAAAAEHLRRQEAQAIAQSQTLRTAQMNRQAPPAGYEPPVVEPIPTVNPPQAAETTKPEKKPVNESPVSGDTAAYKPIRSSKNKAAQQPIKPRAKVEKVEPAEPAAPVTVEKQPAPIDVEEPAKTVALSETPAKAKRTLELGHTDETIEKHENKRKFIFNFGKNKKNDDFDDDFLDDYDEIDPVDEDDEPVTEEIKSPVKNTFKAPAVKEEDLDDEDDWDDEDEDDFEDKPKKSKLSFFKKPAKKTVDDDDGWDDEEDWDDEDDETDDYDDEDDWDDEEDDGKFPVRPLIIGILGMLNVCGIAVIVLMLLGII